MDTHLDTNERLRARFQTAIAYVKKVLIRPFAEEYAPIHIPSPEMLEESERESILPVLNAVARANRINRIQRRSFVITESILVAASILSASIFSYFAQQIAASSTIGLWTLVMMSPLALMVVFPVIFVLMSKHNKRAGELLASLKDVRLAPALLDVRRDMTGLGSQNIIEALIDVLTRVKASDSALFLDRHHHRMCNYLYLGQQSPHTWKLGVEFRIAILKCLEQIGTRNDLPCVARLARREPKSDKEAQIVQAAQECLISLGSRLGSDIAGETLLRPAMPEADKKLLRPAIGVTIQEETQLLRAFDQ